VFDQFVEGSGTADPGSGTLYAARCGVILSGSEVCDVRPVAADARSDAPDRAVLPALARGLPRVDDRRVISGIIYVIRNGLQWKDAPRGYGPHQTLYNRFVRWSRLGVSARIASIAWASKRLAPSRRTASAGPRRHRADGEGQHCYRSSWRIGSFGSSGRLVTRPRYAA
jgi:transposase